MDTTARLKIIAFSGAEFADYNADGVNVEGVAAGAQQYAEDIAAERGYYKVLNIHSSEIATEIARGHYPTNDFEWVEGDEALAFADEVAHRMWG